MSISEPQSRFRQLAALIRQQIEEGAYPRGEYLPSENELAKLHNVSTATVNRALLMLRLEGLVRVVRGRGTIVHEIQPLNSNRTDRYVKAAREAHGGRGAFDAEVRALGYEPRSVLVQLGPVTPPAEVADVFELPHGEDNVIIRKRQMFANDTPVQLAPSYIPRIFRDGTTADGTQLAEEDSGPGGILSRFAEMGKAQRYIEERVRVRRPTDEELSFFQLTDEQQIIEIFHVGRTADDEPVEVCVHAMPSHQWKLNYRWAIEDPEDATDEAAVEDTSS